MKRMAIFAALAAVAAAQAPDVATIMERVGRNQAQAVAQRQEFTFHQKQLLRLIRGNGKLAREENREYDVTPSDHAVKKELLRLDGKYEYKGKYVPYDRAGYKYKGLDVDGDLIQGLSEDTTNDSKSRDGIGADGAYCLGRVSKSQIRPQKILHQSGPSSKPPARSACRHSTLNPCLWQRPHPCPWRGPAPFPRRNR